MNEDIFLKIAKSAVQSYVVSHLDKRDNIDPDTIQIYAVWLCRIIGNSKALLSTNLPDGMYYEVTYNGDTHEIYLDAYKKFQSISIDLNEAMKQNTEGEANEAN